LRKAEFGRTEEEEEKEKEEETQNLVDQKIYYNEKRKRQISQK
jgi:hypothetical protein